MYGVGYIYVQLRNAYTISSGAEMLVYIYIYTARIGNCFKNY